MPSRCCPYCRHNFQPSPYHLQQRVCSQLECQKRRRADYYRQKIQTDPLYAQVVRDSRRQWQAEHADYQKAYWQGKRNPSSTGLRAAQSILGYGAKSRRKPVNQLSGPWRVLENGRGWSLNLVAHYAPGRFRFVGGEC